MELKGKELIIMKILLFGSQGYLGGAYLKSEIFNNNQFITPEIDITKLEQVEKTINNNKPDVIINCAGQTNLEWCRDNQVESFAANVSGPQNILKWAVKNNAYFVHLSTGCIFEGAGQDGRGFTEDDEPTPRCFYAETKSKADALLMESQYDKLLILRLRLPISPDMHLKNLISKVINFSALSDSQNSMTYVPDLIAATKFLIENNQSGIFNVCNSGTISPYEIANMAKQIGITDKELRKVSKQELDEMEKKSGKEHRVDAIMNMNKLENLGFKMENIKTRAIEAMEKYKQIM